MNERGSIINEVDINDQRMHKELMNKEWKNDEQTTIY